MTFSRCSSAGVHGVLVLLFFGGGIVGSLVSSTCCPISPSPPRLVEGMVEDIVGEGAIVCDPGALRLLRGGDALT